MRKAFLLVVFACMAMVAVTTGCSNKKAEATDSPSIDSTAMIDTADTVDSATEVIAETPMPKAADQLFDDFFFNFIANKKLQRSRIKFPLPVVMGDKTLQMKREQWKTDHFFRRQGYYTLIFDNAKQLDAAKSTDIDSVIVEKIHLKQGLVEQYWFDHQEGKWLLSQIRHVSFNDSYNSSFYAFLPKFFASDGRGYIKDPLPYSGPDPNGEETTTINTTIPASEWMTFLPEIPSDMIYNILYGQPYTESNKKILTFRGLSNGMETQLVFRRNGKNWQLVKINAY